VVGELPAVADARLVGLVDPGAVGVSARAVVGELQRRVSLAVDPQGQLDAVCSPLTAAELEELGDGGRIDAELVGAQAGRRAPPPIAS
jgi:hypothetical protein